MSNFKIGEKVVCLYNLSDYFYGEETPKKGIVYTVRAIKKTKSGIGICLEEIINKFHLYHQGLGELHFNEGNFVKQNQTSEVIISELIADAKRETILN